MSEGKPDFNNGIVGLMEWLGSAMGSQSAATVLPPEVFRQASYADQLGEAQHVVLVILDGLGYQYLLEQPNSFLFQTLVGRMSSVFPSSTAPAVSAYLSGLSPASHGIFGWHQWLGSVGQVCASLPFASRSLGVSLADYGVQISDCFSFSSFFERLARPSWAYSPEDIVCSPFNRYATRGATRVGYESWTDLVPKVVSTMQAAQSTTYQYLYYSRFDSSCHAHGLNSNKTAAEFQRLDQGVAQLIAALAGEDAVVMITADHGMIDTTAEQRLRLHDFPEVANRLTVPLCGEPRVVYCHVRANERETFPQVIAEQLGDYCACYPAQALVAEGWFGPELSSVPPHQYDALGDFVLVMKDHYTLQDFLPGENAKTFIGMHGGVSSAEMEVPLCWAVP